MISTAQQSYIAEHAYVPEQMVHYVTAVSGAEPFLLGDFLLYRKKETVIFVGYSLQKAFESEGVKKVLDEAIQRFKPGKVSLTAPIIPRSIRSQVCSSFDHYYRIDLSTRFVSQKVRNMVNRAGRDLSVEKRNTFDKDHKLLVREFLDSHKVNGETRFIFQRISDYVSSSETAWVFEAKNSRGELVAFDVVEGGPRDYAFYMFNFASRTRFVPGASDLLLSEVIRFARAEQKRYINLGLGINPGVTFFKGKWGGIPFLPYAYCAYRPSREERLEDLLQKL